MRHEDNDIQRLERAREAGAQLDDHNAELSETKAGRIYTSGVNNPNRRNDAREQRSRRADAQLTALQSLMSDPEYAALYTETVDAVTQAQIAAEAAMTSALEALQQSEDDLTDLQGNAAQLAPSGERAYRDQDGNVYTEDGRKLGEQEAESVVFPEDAPSYEDYLAQKKAAQDARERVEAIRLYQDRLGGYQNRLNDPDNPLTPDELRGIQEDIEANLVNISNTRPAEQTTAAASPTADIILPPPST